MEYALIEKKAIAYRKSHTTPTQHCIARNLIDHARLHYGFDESPDIFNSKGEACPAKLNWYFAAVQCTYDPTKDIATAVDIMRDIVKEDCSEFYTHARTAFYEMDDLPLFLSHEERFAQAFVDSVVDGVLCDLIAYLEGLDRDGIDIFFTHAF